MRHSTGKRDSSPGQVGFAKEASGSASSTFTSHRSELSSPLLRGRQAHIDRGGCRQVFVHTRPRAGTPDGASLDTAAALELIEPGGRWHLDHPNRARHGDARQFNPKAPQRTVVGRVG